jgi:hypothetical protein
MQPRTAVIGTTDTQTHTEIDTSLVFSFRFCSTTTIWPKNIGLIYISLVESFWNIRGKF